MLFLSLSFFAFSMTACFSPSNETEKEEEEQLASKQEKEEEEEDDGGTSINIKIGDDKIEIDNEDLQKGLNSLKEAFENIEINIDSDVEPVDFRELKKLLPSSVRGMDRTDYSGEKAGALGIMTSTATATYEDKTKEITISLVDIGGFKAALNGLAIWSSMEVDKESDSGYERTTMIDGHKAYEKYDSDLEEGEIAIIVNDRFVVNIEGDNISEKDLKSALRKIDLDDLEDLDEEI